MQDTNWFKLTQEFVFWLVATTLALFIAIYIPLIGLVLAVPLVLFSIRYDTRMGIGLTIAIATLLGLLLDKTIALAFLAEFGILSQALVVGFRRKFINLKIIAVGFLVTIIAGTILTTGMTSLSGEKNLSAHVEEHLEESYSQFLQVYEPTQATNEQKRALKQALEMAKIFLLKTYVGVYASITLLFVVGNCFVSKLVLTKIGYELADTSPFSRLVIPEHFVWGFIASAGLLVTTMLTGLDASFAHIVGLNLTLFFTTVYLVQGLSIVFFLGERIKLPYFLKALGLFLLIIQPFLLLLTAGAGLFDIWFDLRKLQKKPAL